MIRIVTMLCTSLETSPKARSAFTRVTLACGVSPLKVSERFGSLPFGRHALANKLRHACMGLCFIDPRFVCMREQIFVPCMHELVFIGTEFFVGE